MIFQHRDTNYTFIHLPKTGGMWFRHCVFASENPQFKFVDIAGGLHGQTMENATTQIVFILRHPLDRFLSGVRFNNNAHDDADMHSRIERIMASDIAQDMIYRPLTQFQLKDFAAYEHKIAAVFDHDTLTDAVTKFIPPVSQCAEYKNKINHTQSQYVQYNANLLKPEHAQWINTVYAQDIELYNYIKQQPYYIKGE